MPQTPQSDAARQASLFSEPQGAGASKKTDATPAAKAAKTLAPEAAAATRALWAAIDAKSPSWAALELAQALRQSNRLDLRAEVGYNKERIAERWAYLVAYDNCLMDEAALEAVCAWAKEDGLDVWASGDKAQPRGLLGSMLTGVEHDMERLADERNAKRLEWLVRNAPMKALLDWRPWREHSKRAAPCALLSWMVEHEAPAAATLALLDRGFTIKDAKSSYGEPLARDLSRVELWERFLAEGGDGAMTVHTRSDEAASQPLWQLLRGRQHNEARQALAKAAEAWASQHAAGGLSAQRDAEYWKGFEYGYNGLGKHMKSDPDWPNKRDAQGRTPMMRLVMRHIIEYKSFSTIKKAQDGVLAKDKAGRTLWAYMMSKGKEMSAESAGWLAGAIPFELDAKGRGLFAQALSIEKASDHEILFFNEKVFTAVSTPELWWGKSREAQDDAAKKIVDAWWGSERDSSVSRFIENVAMIVRRFPSASVSSSLGGALALSVIMARSPYGEKDSHGQALRSLLEKGAILPTTDAMSETLLSRFEALRANQKDSRSELLEEAIAHSEANALRGELDARAGAEPAQEAAAKASLPSRRL
jgi:hypothetical protein